jgi:hypothetical protein
MPEVITAPAVTAAPPPPANPMNLPPGVKQPSGEFGAKNFFPSRAPDGSAIVPPANGDNTPPPPPASPTSTLSEKMADAAGLRKLEEKKIEAPPPAKPAGDQPPPAVDADAFDFEKVELPPKVSEKSSEAFKLVKAQAKAHIAKLRSEQESASKRVEALETQLKTAPVGTMTNAEVEKMKSDLKAMSERVLLTDLQSHPDFQRQFTQPKAQAITAAAEILTSQKVEGVDLQKLLALPRAEFAKQVSEVAAKLPSFDATEFSAQMRQAYTLTQSESQALTKSHDTYAAIQKNQTEQGVAAFNRAMEKVGGEVTKLLVKVTPPTGATAELVEQINAYNADIDALQGKARKLALEPSSPDEVAVSAIKAAAYDFHIKQALPKILGEYQNLQRAYAEKVAELEAVKGKNPNNMGFMPPAPAAAVQQKELENIPQDERIGFLAKKFYPRRA